MEGDVVMTQNPCSSLQKKGIKLHPMGIVITCHNNQHEMPKIAQMPSSLGQM